MFEVTVQAADSVSSNRESTIELLVSADTMKEASIKALEEASTVFDSGRYSLWVSYIRQRVFSYAQ